ncbi:MAG: hypothetical protein QM677_02990 [Microbacterium sp.]
MIWVSLRDVLRDVDPDARLGHVSIVREPPIERIVPLNRRRYCA